MKVLVTGAIGVNGLWTVRQLLASGCDVVATDMRGDLSDFPELRDSVPYHRLHINDLDAFVALCKAARPDCICHIAALVPADKDPFLGYTVNAMGTVTVLETAVRADVERVVFMSSKGVYAPFDGEYGYPTYQPVQESYPRDSKASSRVYDSAKILSEDAGRHYRERCGLSFVALRFGTIYGPGKIGRPGRASLYTEIVDAAIRGVPLTVRVVENELDDLVYVKDVALATTRACTAESPASWAYNIANGVGVSTAMYVDMVMNQLPSAEITIEQLNDQPVFQSGCVMDVERARRELGFVAEYPLELGVADLIDIMS